MTGDGYSLDGFALVWHKSQIGYPSKGNFMCEHLASFREGYLPSESALHATK
jgi:hypothetical protein